MLNGRSRKNALLQLYLDSKSNNINIFLIASYTVEEHGLVETSERVDY